MVQLYLGRYGVLRTEHQGTILVRKEQSGLSALLTIAAPKLHNKESGAAAYQEEELSYISGSVHS